jgi:hypothetical protein
MFLLRAVTIALSLISAPLSAAGCGCEDNVIILPLTPPEDSWESVQSLEFDDYKDPVTGEVIRACILNLEAYPMELGEGVPVDEDGQQLVIDIDGMTWLPLWQIHDSINPDTCDWY